MSPQDQDSSPPAPPSASSPGEGAGTRATGKARRLVRTVVWVVVIGAAFTAGLLMHMGLSAPPAPRAGGGAAEVETVETVWTCSMHPQIRRNEPGPCPICGMDLIPVDEEETADTALRQLTVSRAARALMDVATEPVERRYVTAEIRMVGKVDYDETRLADVTAWVPGRLDRLFVDYTGVPVREGDHLVYIYSPELLSAQEELLQARRAAEEIRGSELGIVRETTKATVEAAREKLRLLGLTRGQVEEIEVRGEPVDHLTIHSPVSGIVIHMHAQEGSYVQTGTRIYTVADLSEVWIRLDAYESDLMWLRYGQDVEFTTLSYPGEIFHGTISFIDPILTPQTRTVKVRLDADNPDGRLKPGMFVKAVAKARVAAGGKVMDPDLAGKWICRMHPGVVRDEPGDCPICGMPLVRTDTLGYVSADREDEAAPLVVPASAVLITGTRAVAYVEVPGTDRPTFEGREVVLGPRAGDYYIVEQGLAEGERVVTRGNFKIDSALQIQARPSMMSPDPTPGAPATGVHTHAHVRPADVVPPELRRGVQDLLHAYMEVRSALAADELDRAGAAARQARERLAALAEDLPADRVPEGWEKYAASLETLLGGLEEARDIEGARRAFAPFSEELTAAARAFAPSQGEPLYELHCPMAFDGRGANWLQTTRDVSNPYFGEVMLRCGSVTGVIRTGDGSTDGPAEGSGGGR